MDIPATCVAEGSEELEKVKIMNENYEKVLSLSSPYPLCDDFIATFNAL